MYPMQDNAVLYSDRIIDRIYQIIKMLNWHRSDLLTHFAFLFNYAFIKCVFYRSKEMAAVTSACSIDRTTRRKEDLYARMALLVVVADHRWSYYFSVPGLAACDFVCVWRTHRWITSTQGIFWMMRTLWERASPTVWTFVHSMHSYGTHFQRGMIGTQQK